MKTTEGAWVPFMGAGLIGGVYGGIQNIGYQIGRNQGWNWWSFGGAVALGAIGGYLRKLWGIKQIPIKMTLAPATMGLRVVHGRVMTKYVQPRWDSFKSRYFRR